MEECSKSNTPPWVFFTFFMLYKKWYQIAQSFSYKPHEKQGRTMNERYTQKNENLKNFEN